MAIVVGDNSWETIAEADAYLGDRIGSQAWFLLSDTAAQGEFSKESLLISAFRVLVNKNGYDLPASLTDDAVKYAQSEMALYLLSNSASFDQQSDLLVRGVQSFKLSKWEEDYGTSSSWQGDFPLPAMVSKWLDGYLLGSNRTVNLSGE